MKSVLISIVTYTNHAAVLSCLESLTRVKHGTYSVSIQIVNNNPEKEFTYDGKLKTNVTIINSRKNLGFSGGHNRSLNDAVTNGTDFVLVLNDDTVHDEDFLVELLHAAEDRDDGGVFVPKIYFVKGHEFHKERYKKDELGKVIWYAGGEIDWKNLIISHRGVDLVDNGQFASIEETTFATGCCMLIRTETLRNVGVFDERYFLYLEDSDLNERIKKAGWKIYFVPQSVIWHENAGSTGGSGSALQDYFITRNRMLFGMTYAPFRTKFALLRESIRLLASGRVWQKKGVRDYFLRNFGKGSYHV